MLAPIRRNKDLLRVQPRTDLHPLIILRIHPPEALQVPKPRRHVLPKVACIRGPVLVEVLKVRPEEVRGVRALGEAALQRVVLEEVDVQPELVSSE